MQQMTIDLSELDAWAEQVDRASADLEGISRNAQGRLTQSDFGPILETMMGSYNTLTSQVNTTLAEDAKRVQNHAEALRATARDFALTETGIAARYRSPFADARDGSSRFWDVADTTIASAKPSVSELPRVSFGFPYDTVCDIVRMLTGFDIRAELAEKIGGDVVSASTQGSSFEGLGKAMKGVSQNLAAGGREVAGTWEGGASDAALNQIGQWVGELDSQAGRLVQMGINLVQTCRNAWNVAKSVVQCIKSAVQTVSSALATMSIPGVGWARVVQAVFQALMALMKAFKVIKQFISLLKTLVGYIKQIKTFFDTGKLPDATATEGASGAPGTVIADPGAVTPPEYASGRTPGGTAPAPAPVPSPPVSSTPPPSSTTPPPSSTTPPPSSSTPPGANDPAQPGGNGSVREPIFGGSQ